MLSNRIAGLGLSIMAVGGYAATWAHRSQSRDGELAKPPVKIHSLAVYYSVGNLRHRPNHGAVYYQRLRLGMLLMVTLFPTLVSLGVSRLCGGGYPTTMSIEWGILESDSIFAAQVAGIKIARLLPLPASGHLLRHYWCQSSTFSCNALLTKKIKYRSRTGRAKSSR
ncbi:hypothetical protein ACNKHX_19850 [Shigella flexneri]